MKSLLASVFCLLLLGNIFAQQQEVPYTLADRDRLIHVEADIGSLRNEMNGLRNEMSSVHNEMNSLRNEMNAKFEAVYERFESIDQRFESIDQRFESLERSIVDIKTILYWGFGILFSFMLFLLGFIMWDRRSTLGPVRTDIEA